jgi:predicted enzyme related to lactoylglutathione lyase
MRGHVKHFNGICIITRDVKRLRGFYQDVLQVESEGDDAFAQLSIEGAGLSLFAEQNMDQLAPGSMEGAGHGSYTLEIEVEDVDAEFERLTKMHVAIVKPPTTQPWGWRSVWFRDPDGNIVNFAANVAG